MTPDPKGASPDPTSDASDEIEILEVVGVDDDLPPGGDPDEIEVTFDETPGDRAVLKEDPEIDPDRPASGPDHDTRERLIRLQADFENFKKRIDRERDEYYRHSTATLVARLLPVLDNVELAISASRSSADAGSLREGVALIHRQFLEELRREGLQPVESIGQPFDPNVHEAAATEATADHAPNTVIEELRRGYFFHDRLLRPALVRVSMDGSAGDDPCEDGEES